MKIVEALSIFLGFQTYQMKLLPSSGPNIHLQKMSFKSFARLRYWNSFSIWCALEKYYSFYGCRCLHFIAFIIIFNLVLSATKQQNVFENIFKYAWLCSNLSFLQHIILSSYNIVVTIRHGKARRRKKWMPPNSNFFISKWHRINRKRANDIKSNQNIFIRMTFPTAPHRKYFSLS